jgi:hypothetical protein
MISGISADTVSSALAASGDKDEREAALRDAHLTALASRLQNER